VRGFAKHCQVFARTGVRLNGRLGGRLFDLYRANWAIDDNEQAICRNTLFENHIAVGAILSFGLLRTSLGGEFG
tara:strand:+ start:258 stop:479 length:222 start_codon:yes stop_codon:yes gene_type:complete